MQLLDPTYIRGICDYSFGDESGHHLADGYMKKANAHNDEFTQLVLKAIHEGKPYLTLFIDNIRLYRRAGIKYTAVEQMQPKVARIKDAKVAKLHKEDLLLLLRLFPNMNFVIFTAFEDTPIDEFIEGRIPENVLKIFACNCMWFDGVKVIPIPYGLQRKLNSGDNRHEMLKAKMHQTVTPTKLLYINLRIANNPIRANIPELFDGKDWVTRESPNGIDSQNYNHYLDGILSHKFVLCPPGNAPVSECHRDWETIYLRRVPVLIRNTHVEYIFKGAPVLFVNSFSEITEQLLIDNNHLFEEMQNLDMNRLDISKVYENLIAQV